MSNVRALPQHLKRAAKAIWRFRPPERLWTLFLAVVAVALGAFLVIAPAKDLATGRSFGFQALISFCWLFTGLATFAGGMGIFLRLPSIRLLFKIAFTCSLPVAGAFAYRTVTFALKMRTGSESDRELLEPYVSAGVQLSAFFIGTSIFLFFLLHSKGLKGLHCSGGVLAGRYGWLIRGVVGAAMGSGAGYVVWVVFRWVSDPANALTKDVLEDIEWIDKAIVLVPIEFFLAGGALLGAVVAITVFWFRIRHRPSRQPAAPTPAGGQRPRQLSRS